MTTTVEVLKAAREIISAPEHWCQGATARDADGVKTYPADPDACRWCAYGALLKAAGNFRAADDGPLLLAAQLPRGVGIGVFNDSHEHAEVIAVFDKAIETEELRQPEARP